MTTDAETQSAGDTAHFADDLAVLLATLHRRGIADITALAIRLYDDGTFSVQCRARADGRQVTHEMEGVLPE